MRTVTSFIRSSKTRRWPPTQKNVCRMGWKKRPAPGEIYPTLHLVGKVIHMDAQTHLEVVVEAEEGHEITYEAVNEVSTW